MSTNRLNVFERNRLWQFLPRAEAAQKGASVNSGYMYIPLAPQHAIWQNNVYQIAYEQARIALAPPRYLSLLSEN